jgi:uncharacterized protein
MAHVFQALLAENAGGHRLLNRSRDLLLAAIVEPAFESSTRRKGLLGRRALPFNSVLAIAPSNAIHTFGMQFALDLLFISREGKVVKRVLNLKARRVSAALRAFAVLEFAAGHPGVKATQVGDQLVLVPEPPPESSQLAHRMSEV